MCENDSWGAAFLEQGILKQIKEERQKNLKNIP